MRKSIIIILLVLIIDQALKIWIKTTMELRDSIEFFSWFQLYFTENPGMAFGLEYGGNYGKLALSIFRILAIFGLLYWLNSLIRKKAPGIALVAVSMITAGAIGNMIDSAFYGLISTREWSTVKSFRTGSVMPVWQNLARQATPPSCAETW